MNAPKRSCDNCTKCCDGWLSANVNGIQMAPGRPCQFVRTGKGCGIYSKRPHDPCRSYQCGWLTDGDLPEWMKPSEINAIVDHRRTNNGTFYYNIVEAGEDLSAQVLTWMVDYCSKKGYNLSWQFKGQTYWLGSPEFMQEVTHRHHHAH